MQTDDVGALVRAAAEGDKSAWNALVMRFSGLVWSVARAHRLSATDAEDVYQTTWLRLMEHIGKIKEPQRVAGWIATTAQREVLKALHIGRRATLVRDLDLLEGGMGAQLLGGPKWRSCMRRSLGSTFIRSRSQWRCGCQGSGVDAISRYAGMRPSLPRCATWWGG